MKIGILGAAEIALRRFLPALAKRPELVYAGVASRTREKAVCFQEAYGGKIYETYDDLLDDEGIDCVYVPLPPALHSTWGRRILESGKHLLMEKPFTTTLGETKALLDLAWSRQLAAYENYMFLCHKQLTKAKDIISSGELGELRLLRMSFGFPKRGEDDFRYQKKLGGGALLDCGGYPVRLGAELLGENMRVVQSELCCPAGYEVDLYGCAVLENEDHLCAQISFGMDNAYQCQLEAWGSKATLVAPRIFTAGPDICPQLILHSSAGECVLDVGCDDHFAKSIDKFLESTENSRLREQIYTEILRQAEWIETIQQTHQTGVKSAV